MQRESLTLRRRICDDTHRMHPTEVSHAKYELGPGEVVTAWTQMRRVL